MQNGAERAGDVTRATARHTPSHTHQTPLLLLRFSSQVRDELERWESSSTARHSQTHETPARQTHEAWANTPNEWGQSPLESTTAPHQFSKRRKGRKARRWLVGMLVFGLGAFVAMSLGLLELRYRHQHQHQALLGQQTKGLQALERALQPGAKAHPKLTQHPAIRAFGKVHAVIAAAHARHCQPPPKAPTESAGTAAQVQHRVRDWMQRWQHWLWAQLGNTYVRQRKTLWASTKTQAPKQQFCALQPLHIQAVAQKSIRAYHSRLLRSAKKHMQDYTWCQMTWSRVAVRPQHHEWLQKLRQFKCRATCKQPSSGVPSPACAACLRQWRGALALDTTRFQRYHSLATEARRRRCHTWAGKPAHSGVFHLGAYYKNVAQVLAHTQWLASQKRCDARCKTLRKTWGAQLTITSKPGPGRIYLRLWSSRAAAPTPALARLAQISLGQTGKTPRWVPALRFAKVMPRDAWMLIQVYHPGSKKRAYIPVLPRPGQQLKVHLRLYNQALHNDGRQPVRHPTIASDGSKLAFLTYRMTPWESQPLFAAPYCWRAPGQVGLSWRAAISLYPLTIKGQPTGRGQHLYTTQWLREIRLVKRGAQLLVSAALPPATMTPPPAQQDAAPKAGLWKLNLSMSLALAGKRALQLTPQPQPAHIDLPVASTTSTLLLRRACALAPGTVGALQLLQVPATAPPQVTSPAGHKVVHAAQNRRWFALLLHPKGRATGSALALFSRRTAAIAPQPTRLLRLRVRHRQIVATRDGFLFAGGGWGSPLQSWTAKGVQHLTPSNPAIRYLDPIRHPQSQRLFVIQQRRALGTKHPKSHATFLLSWRRQGAQP